MLQKQEDKLPKITEIDNAFDNIEHDYYAERKYKIKKSVILLLLYIFYFTLIVVVFKLLNKGWDWAFIMIMFWINIVLIEENFKIDFIVSNLNKFLPLVNKFSQKSAFIESTIKEISSNIYSWIHGRENIDITQNYNLLTHLKKKIYTYIFLSTKGKSVLKFHSDDLLVTDIDIKQIYYLGILKDDTYKDIYEFVDTTAKPEYEKIQLLLNKFKKLEIEFSKIQKIPQNTFRIDKIASFINDFKLFDFNNIEVYQKLKQLSNYGLKGVFYDIGRRRLQHTIIDAILRNKESYQNAKSFFDFIEPKETQFSLYPFSLYFKNLKDCLKKFENYLSQYNIKLETVQYTPPPLSIKKTYNYSETNEKNKTIKENLPVNNINININASVSNLSSKNKTQNVETSSTQQNAKIGLFGEIYVLGYEKQKLKNLPMYANAIEHTSQVKGDSVGYDIKSFTLDGESIFIEVKTTIGDLYSNFFITKNEMEILKSHNNYYLYRVFEFDEEKKLGKLKIYKTINQINEDFEIFPVSYSVKPNV